MNDLVLNNGVKMPQLGFGVFQMDQADECQRVVEEAIGVGYRLIDTAATYGNEASVGRAIKNSHISRDHFFITSKLWVSDFQGDKPTEAIDRSLKQLGSDYLDLYLLHMPYGDVFNAWRALEQAYHAGKIRAIGVSNFTADQLMNLELFNDVKPAVNQIEINPWNQRELLKRFCEQQDVQVEAWAPFAEGQNHLFTNPILSQIAQAHQKQVGQVVLRWLMQRGIVTIPKSVHRQRMVENFDIFDFQLNADEMKMIESLNLRRSFFFDPRDPAAIKSIVGGGRPGANQD